MTDEVKFVDLGVTDEVISLTLQLMSMSNLLRQTMKRINTRMFEEQPANSCVPNTVNLCVNELRKTLNVPMNTKVIAEYVDENTRNSLAIQCLQLASDMLSNNISMYPHQGSIFSDVTNYDFETIKQFNPATYGDLINILVTKLDPTQGDITRDFIDNYAREISEGFNTSNEFVFKHVLKEVRRFVNVYNNLNPEQNLAVSVSDIVNINVVTPYGYFTDNDIIFPLLDSIKENGNYTQTQDKDLSNLLNNVSDEELEALMDTGNAVVNTLVSQNDGLFPNLKEFLIESNKLDDITNITGVKDTFLTYWARPFYNIIFYRSLSLLEDTPETSFSQLRETAYFNLHFWIYVFNKRISRVKTEINEGKVFSRIFSDKELDELGSFDKLGGEPFTLAIHEDTLSNMNNTTEFDMEDLLAALLAHGDVDTFTIDHVTSNMESNRSVWQDRLNNLESILYQNAFTTSMHFMKKAFDVCIEESRNEVVENNNEDQDALSILIGNTDTSEINGMINSLKLNVGQQLSLSEIICKLVIGVRFKDINCYKILFPLTYKTDAEIKEADIFIPTMEDVSSFIVSNFKVTI